MNRFQRFEDIDTSGEQPLPRPPASVTVTVWDIGPRLNSAVPKQPDSTAPPGEWEDYETDVSQHVAAVLRYRRERAEFIQKHGSNPIRLELDPVSARECIEHGAGRYVLTLPSGLMLGPSNNRT
jgi:hypothetical protein